MIKDTVKAAGILSKLDQYIATMKIANKEIPHLRLDNKQMDAVFDGKVREYRGYKVLLPLE